MATAAAPLMGGKGSMSVQPAVEPSGCASCTTRLLDCGTGGTTTAKTLPGMSALAGGTSAVVTAASTPTSGMRASGPAALPRFCVMATSSLPAWKAHGYTNASSTLTLAARAYVRTWLQL